MTAEDTPPAEGTPYFESRKNETGFISPRVQYEFGDSEYIFKIGNNKRIVSNTVRLALACGHLAGVGDGVRIGGYCQTCMDELNGPIELDNVQDILVCDACQTRCCVPYCKRQSLCGRHAAPGLLFSPRTLQEPQTPIERAYRALQIGIRPDQGWYEIQAQSQRRLCEPHGNEFIELVLHFEALELEAASNTTQALPESQNDTLTLGMQIRQALLEGRSPLTSADEEKHPPHENTDKEKQE